MPGYKGHLAGGCVVYGLMLGILYGCLPYEDLAKYGSSPLIAMRWLICALAGSLFPDIDVKSKGQKYFYWVILAFFLVLIAQRQFRLLAASSIVAVFPMLVKHRGIFHKTWFVILAPLSLWMLLVTYAPAYSQILFFDMLFFIVGALSHLWLDLGLKRMIRL
jgi:hypothetical protein